MNWYLRVSGVLGILLAFPADLLWAMHPDFDRIFDAKNRHTSLNATPAQSGMGQSSGPIKLKQPAKTALCAGSDAIVLEAPDLPATYTWYWNSVAISGLNTHTQVVSQPGKYYARVRDKTTGTETNTDTITLTIAPNPLATLSAANATGTLCERDSLKLTAGGGTSYRWFFNNREIIGSGQSTLFARQAGQYSVLATDANGCQATSEPITVAVQDRPKPRIDSIPVLCGMDARPINLHASPPGGVFSGKGVSGSVFDPQLAGLGSHTINYDSPVVNGCSGERSQRTVRVYPRPTAQLPEQIITTRQGIFTLEPTVNGSGPFLYRWRPAVWLNNPTLSMVTVAFPQQDTTYTVQVSDVFGCTAEASTRILIRAKVSIPDAFTPNGDQINDSWKLPGIESFPEAQVTIANRWGEVIYRSYHGYLTPFDGRYNGEPLPTGVYLYLVKLSPESEPLRGSVVLAR